MKYAIHNLMLLCLAALMTGCSLSSGAPSRGDMAAIKEKFEAAVPEGWRVEVNKSTVTLYSPKMPLLPLASAAFKGKTDSCELVVRVGERISEDQHERRLRTYVPPRSKEELLQKQPWIPDFYDDKFAYRIDEPGYMPETGEDLVTVYNCYKLLRSQWTTYTRSGHVDEKYFWNILTADGTYPLKKRPEQPPPSK